MVETDLVNDLLLDRAEYWLKLIWDCIIHSASLTDNQLGGVKVITWHPRQDFNNKCHGALVGLVGILFPDSFNVLFNPGSILSKMGLFSLA